MRYLLITFYRKPGGAIDEQPGVSKRLNPRDLQTCNIIVDFQDKKVVKCVVERQVVPTDYDTLVSYYKQIYPELIEQLNKNNSQPQPTK